MRKELLMGFGWSLTDYGLSGREWKKVLPDVRYDLVKVRSFAESPAVLMAVPVAVMKSEGQKVKLTTDFAVGKRRHK